MKKLKYKGIPVGPFGIPFYEPKKQLKKKKEPRWFKHQAFDFKFDKEAPKNLIVMYDVPHNMKKERDWFRRHLQKFNYVMIQKSVWVGPSPLKKEFVEYVKSINLQKKLKTFKLAKPYSNKEKIFI